MPRIYLSARGEPVDFDAQLIKQQLASAPMTVDVAQRKTFIESKEVRKRAEAPVEYLADAPEAEAAPADDFEVEEAPKAKRK
jgi:hypothetical protein